MRRCLSCKIDISKRHLNAKRCEACASSVRKKPIHNLTKQQQREALSLAGTMYRREIAKQIGCSHAALNRFARDSKVNFNAHKYDKKTVQKVCDYYINHTLDQTRKKFPSISVRSIIDRYISEVKCYKWSDKEYLSLVRYSGLVPWSYIAVKLGRQKNAARRKYRRVLAGRVNCLPHNITKYFVREGCPFFYIRLDLHSTGLWMCPWFIINKFKKRNLPKHIKQAIKAMAKFQIWLHGSEENILMILEQKA